MHVIKTNFNGNPNLGLYGYVTDTYCLLGLDVPNDEAKKAEEIFGVPVHRMNIAGTSLLGAFLTGNETTLLVPNILFDTELKKLEELGINYKIIETDLTALGNNIAVSQKGAIASIEYPKDVIEQISEALGVPVKQTIIADVETVGSVIVGNKKGIGIHRDIEDSEKVIIEETLGYECTPTTVNMGSPHLSSGVLANSNGFMIGDLSGGPEVVYMDEILGFIDLD